MNLVEEGKKTLEQAEEMIDLAKSWEKQHEEHLADPEVQKSSMEYDMRSTQWFVDKVRAGETYAQNLYAAICNNDFYKPSPDDRERMLQILKDDYPQWGASWRSAGGIVAHLRGKGDYMDWYCSGISQATAPDNGYVAESVVTDEIREDLLKLGWIVNESGNTNF
jgi:hypothetical protein